MKLDPTPKAKYLQGGGLRRRHLVEELPLRRGLEGGHRRRAAAEEARRSEAAKPKKGKKGEEPRRQVSTPKAIPERSRRCSTAFDTYIKYVPDSPELPTIKYRKARIYYEYNHFDEAVPLFKDIADNHQTSDLAIYSANLLFDCLIVKKKYDELQAALDAVLPDVRRRRTRR